MKYCALESKTKTLTHLVTETKGPKIKITYSLTSVSIHVEITVLCLQFPRSQSKRKPKYRHVIHVRN